MSISCKRLVCQTAFVLYNNNIHKYECVWRWPCFSDTFLSVPERWFLQYHLLTFITLCRALSSSPESWAAVYFDATGESHRWIWKESIWHFSSFVSLFLKKKKREWDLFVFPLSCSPASVFHSSTSLCFVQGNDYCFAEYFINFNTSLLIHLTNTFPHLPLSSGNK